MDSNRARQGTSCSQQLTLIGVPMDEGVDRPGTSLGADALRDAGLKELLLRSGMQVIDLGDVSAVGPGRPTVLQGRARNAAAVACWSSALARISYETLRRSERPIFLGGDHSLSIGSTAGVTRHWAEQGRELFVIWLDAHADLNTPLITPSGNLHGMTLAALTGEPLLAPLLAATGHVPIEPRNVLLIGTRSIDFAERAILKAKGFEVCSASAVRRSMELKQLRAFLDRAAACHGAVHVSFDVDVLDPKLAPGVGTPAPGGLDRETALRIMQALRRSGLVTSLDLVELNPLNDCGGATADLAAYVAASLFANPTQLASRGQLQITELENADGRHANEVH